MKGVSIIICCYNSSKRLPHTIKCISEQKLDVDWELIIVNNASTDETFNIATIEWEKNKQSIGYLTIINEEKISLNYARTTGIKNAKYEYVILCDDDNWLDENYCNIAYKIMESDSKIGVLGGRSEAEFNTLPPHWFTSYQREYAVGVQALTSGDISKRGYVWGAGMVIRKSIFINLLNSGFNFLLSDRKGKALSSGGDTEISKWFLIAGYKLWYSEDLYFKHFIPDNRLNIEYFISLTKGFENALETLYLYDYIILNKLHEEKYNKIHINALKTIIYLIKVILKREKRSWLLLNLHLPAIINNFLANDIYLLKSSIKKLQKTKIKIRE